MRDKDKRLNREDLEAGELESILDEILRADSLFDEEEDEEEGEDGLDGLDDGDGPDDEDGPDGEPQPKLKKGKAGLIAGLLALALAIGSGGWYLLTQSGMADMVGISFVTSAPAAPTSIPTPAPSKAMPDLLYETEEVAEGILKAEGVRADIIYVPSEKVPKGLVTLQSVSPGQPVEAGEEPVVYISLGPVPTPTPEPTPLPTPTPKATARPRPTEVPVIEAPVPEVTPCPTG